MNKISINHAKGIYGYNNNNFYSKVSLDFQITLSINEMIERDKIWYKQLRYMFPRKYKQYKSISQI